MGKTFLISHIAYKTYSWKPFVQNLFLETIMCMKSFIISSKLNSSLYFYPPTKHTVNNVTIETIVQSHLSSKVNHTLVKRQFCKMLLKGIVQTINGDSKFHHNYHVHTSWATVTTEMTVWIFNTINYGNGDVQQLKVWFHQWL